LCTADKAVSRFPYTQRTGELAVIALLVLAALAHSLFAHGQDLSQGVDRIFAAYDSARTPGCSLGVIRDGGFVYRKSYGAASLELGVPLSPESVFYVGSVAKQFTAASAVLAAEQGLLSLDDNVRKYIPELPDYDGTITLRQMLNQTSGFRDFLDLIYLSGHDAADFNSPNEILKLIERQKGLNNVPGAEWIYSNTNYFLLGIVLQRATGKTLAEYAAENIFRPLGMAHTTFYDDASVVVPGRVAAYDPGPNGQFLVDWSTTYAVVGGGGLMTTVDDLLLWDNNFYANRLGKGALVKELETPGELNDGNKVAYGMGLIPGNYRGLPTIEHNGSMFGYRADLLRFPDQKFTVICLCNVSNAGPEEKSRLVANIYLKAEMQTDSIPIAAADKGLLDPSLFAGQYLDSRTHTVYSFTASDGHLRAWGSNLRRKNVNQFYDLSGNVLTFEGSKDSMKTSLDMNGEAYFEGARLSEIRLDDTALQSFAGDFKSPELDDTIQLSVEHGNLILKNRSNPPVNLTVIANDEFNAEGSFLIAFHRDKHGRVSGLSLFEPSARGIEFARTN
jgi:CubicO group peptidase (beta-lactamase class C family)